MAGNSEFLSSKDGYLGEPLELRKGIQASFRVLKGNAGLLSRPYRGKGPHLTFGGNLVVFLELQQEALCSSTFLKVTPAYCFTLA